MIDLKPNGDGMTLAEYITTHLDTRAVITTEDHQLTAEIMFPEFGGRKASMSMATNTGWRAAADQYDRLRESLESEESVESH